MGEASGSPGRAKQPLVAALGRGGIENYDAQNRSAAGVNVASSLFWISPDVASSFFFFTGEM